LTNRFSNSAEYDMTDLNVSMFINRLIETNHHLILAENYQAGGTFIIAEGALASRRDQVPIFFRSAFQVNAAETTPQPQPLKRGGGHESSTNLPNSVSTTDVTASPTKTSKNDLPNSSGQESEDVPYTETTPQQTLPKGGEDVKESEDSSYLLLFRPQTSFFWHGPTLLGIDVPFVDLGIGDKRLMLISEGGQSRLSAAKARFASHFIYDDEFRFQSNDDGDDGQTQIYAEEASVGTLPCVIEQRSHLPKVNKELSRVTRAINRLVFKIVESIHPVQEALRGVQGYQDLLENWFLFAAEHARQHAVNAEFSLALTNLAMAWISFICDDCDATDRKTFKWAVTALEFAKDRVSNNIILQLPEDQFVQLRRKVAICMSLLIRHFDILGARSSNEAKLARERQEEHRRQQALEARLQTEDDQYLREILVQSDDAHTQTSGFIASIRTMSIRAHREEVLQQLGILDASRRSAVPEGRVLDDNVLEDRTLFLLASSHSTVSIRWQQVKLIGRGAFGSVYLASNLDTGTLMAVKEIHFLDVAGLLPSLYKSVKDELSVMELLRHPNIVEYYGIEVHRDRVYIFEEYCQGGTLASLLELGRIEDERIIQMYALQMLDGLQYLHSRNIVHRDVKPDSKYSLFTAQSSERTKEADYDSCRHSS
jgi:mitogen-activated protein kinase kinase kinase